MTGPVARSATPSPVDVARLEALAEKEHGATPVPWSWRHECIYGPIGGLLTRGFSSRDAEFIAGLRNADPSLFADHRAAAGAHAVLDEFVNVRGDFYEPRPLAWMVERLADTLGVKLRWDWRNNVEDPPASVDHRAVERVQAVADDLIARDRPGEFAADIGRRILAAIGGAE